MDEDGGAQLRGPLKDGKEGGLVEVPDEVAALVRVGVDVGADLDAGEPEPAAVRRPHAAFEFFQREIGVLHRQRAEAEEAARVRPAHIGDVVVQPA